MEHFNHHLKARHVYSSSNIWQCSSLPRNFILHFGKYIYLYLLCILTSACVCLCIIFALKLWIFPKRIQRSRRAVGIKTFTSEKISVNEYDKEKMKNEIPHDNGNNNTIEIYDNYFHTNANPPASDNIIDSFELVNPTCITPNNNHSSPNTTDQDAFDEEWSLVEKGG